MGTRFDPSLRDAEDAEIVALADRIGALLAPTAALYDAEGRFPHEHFEILHRHGALALTIPKAYGGRGLSLYRTLLFQQHLGRAAGPTALCLGWHLMVFGCLSWRPCWPEAALARLARSVVERGHLVNALLTERDAGNLLRGAQARTRARRSGSGWVLSGHKAFCSSAPALKQMVVYARIDGEPGMAEFVVPMGEGVRILETWDSVGMRSTASHDIVFDEVRLPDEALVHRFGPGPDRPGSLAVASRAWGLQVSALYLGIAEAAREFAIRFADKHPLTGQDGVILDAPAVQARLGEIELLLGAARAQLYGLAERWERYPALQDRLHDEVAITKVTVGRQAVRTVGLANELVGGHSLSRRHPLERLWRDVNCHAFNPPQADHVMAGLARDAIAGLRAEQAQGLHTEAFVLPTDSSAHVVPTPEAAAA